MKYFNKEIKLKIYNKRQFFILHKYVWQLIYFIVF